MAAPTAATAVTIPSPVRFPITTASTSFSCLLPTLTPRRRALRVAAAAAAPTAAPAAPAKPTPPPTSPSGIVLFDPAEKEKVNRLKAIYHEKVVPLLNDEFGYTNVHEVPKIKKIVVNCGLGNQAGNSKGLEAAMKDLAMITGQRPVKTKARKSVASFKIRQGITVGICVTLRRDVMYAFLDRLINLGLPRTRDFIGVNPNSFDGTGNYSIGISEQSVFPEIMYEGQGRQNGMDICIVTTAKTDNEAQRMLALLGMPFAEGGGEIQVVRKKRLKPHHFANKGGGRR